MKSIAIIGARTAVRWVCVGWALLYIMATVIVGPCGVEVVSQKAREGEGAVMVWYAR